MKDKSQIAEQGNLKKIGERLRDLCCTADPRKEPENGLPGFLFALLHCCEDIVNDPSYDFCPVAKPPRMAIPFVSDFFARSGRLGKAISLLYDKSPQIDITNLAKTDDHWVVGSLLEIAHQLIECLDQTVWRLYLVQLPNRFFDHLLYLVRLYVAWEWDAEEETNPVQFWFDYIQDEYSAMHVTLLNYETEMRSRSSTLVCVAKYYVDLLKKRQENLTKFMPGNRRVLRRVAADYSDDAGVRKIELAANMMWLLCEDWIHAIDNCHDFFFRQSKEMPKVRLMAVFMPEFSFRRGLEIFEQQFEGDVFHCPEESDQFVSDFRVAFMTLLDHIECYEYPSEISNRLGQLRHLVDDYTGTASDSMTDYYAHYGADSQYKELTKAMDALGVKIGSYEVALYHKIPKDSLKPLPEVPDNGVLSNELIEMVQQLLAGQAKTHKTQELIYSEQLKANTTINALGNKLKTSQGTLRSVKKTVGKIYGEQEDGAVAVSPRGKEKQCPEMIEDAIKECRKQAKAKKEPNVKEIARDIFNSKKTYKHRYKKWISFRNNVYRAWRREKHLYPITP